MPVFSYCTANSLWQAMDVSDLHKTVNKCHSNERRKGGKEGGRKERNKLANERDSGQWDVHGPQHCYDCSVSLEITMEQIFSMWGVCSTCIRITWLGCFLKFKFLHPDSNLLNQNQHFWRSPQDIHCEQWSWAIVAPEDQLAKGEGSQWWFVTYWMCRRCW